MIFKKDITATVVKIHPEVITRTGKSVRDIDVTVTGRGRSKTQWYQFTEVTEGVFMPLVPSKDYRFTVFVNGLSIGQDHVNKLNVTQAIPQ